MRLLFLSCPRKQTPSRFPNRAPREKAVYRAFFTYHSNSSQKFSQIKKFFPSLEGPRKEVSLHIPQKQGPYGNGCPFPQPYLNMSFWVTSKGALPPGSPHRAPSERDAPLLELSWRKAQAGIVLA
jgi:hypothetical protein